MPMLPMLAHDAAGNVVATLDYLAQYDSDGNVIGLVDFAAHEAAGGKMTDIWKVEGAAGSGTWPEWLGARAHEFRVELAGGRIAALVHRASGHRRERAALESAIAERIAAHEAQRGPRDRPNPADLRDLVGGPDRPLRLDDEGRNAPPLAPALAAAPSLPLIGDVRPVAPEGP